MLVHRILATHLHVAAERNGVDAVIGLASPDAEQTFSESNSELLHTHAQQLGDGIVAELVDQNHESEDHRDRNDGNNEIGHK